MKELAGASDATPWRFSSAVWIVGGFGYWFFNRGWLRRLYRESPYSPVVSQWVRGLDVASLPVMAGNPLGVFWQTRSCGSLISS